MRHRRRRKTQQKDLRPPIIRRVEELSRAVGNPRERLGVDPKQYLRGRASSRCWRRRRGLLRPPSRSSDAGATVAAANTAMSEAAARSRLVETQPVGARRGTVRQSTSPTPAKAVANTSRRNRPSSASSRPSNPARKTPHSVVAKARSTRSSVSVAPGGRRVHVIEPIDQDKWWNPQTAGERAVSIVVSVSDARSGRRRCRAALGDSARGGRRQGTIRHPSILRDTACQPSAAGCARGFLSTAGTRRPSRHSRHVPDLLVHPVCPSTRESPRRREVRCGTQIVRAHEVQVADAGSLRADPIVALRNTQRTGTRIRL